MIPKQAIEKAIEGGWSVGERFAYEFWLPEHFAQIALDPTFWQALGKELEWKDQVCEKCGGECKGAQDPMSGEWDAWCKVCGVNWLDKAEFPQEGFAVLTWAYHAHRFYDLILARGDTEKFWRELLSSSK